jgi:hypothetical protein
MGSLTLYAILMGDWFRYQTRANGSDVMKIMPANDTKLRTGFKNT